MSYQIKNTLAGNKVGMLTVVHITGKQNGRTIWECKCECGNTIEARADKLAAGSPKSCGCLYSRDHKRKPEQEQRFSRRLNGYVQGARIRGFAWELTSEQAYTLFHSDCHYCGTPADEKLTGIDRKNSKEGYTTENTVPCCTYCNYIKNNRPYDEFVAWIKRTYEHLHNK